MYNGEFMIPRVKVTRFRGIKKSYYLWLAVPCVGPKEKVFQEIPDRGH